MFDTATPIQVAAARAGNPNIALIDVRTPAEFTEVHADFARNIPLDRLDAGVIAAERTGSPGGALYVICRSGNRSRQACEKLAAAGLKVANVEGGTNAWIAAGLPAVHGKKTMSLERQVRIAAGLLVLTGAAMGYVVNPYWIGLSAFVGAGLTFAGITDTCGMAMVLARLPWNQANGTCSPPASPTKT